MKRFLSKILGYQFSSDFTAILWLITLVTQFMIYVDGTGRSILGIVLAAEYILLMLTDIYYVIAPMAVIGNSSLGTVIGGSISFPFAAMVLLSFRLIYQYRTTQVKRGYFYAVIAMVLYFIHYAMFQLTGAKIEDTVYLTLAFYFAYASVESDCEKKSFFYTNMAVVIFLSALHALIYGGVVYYEATHDAGIDRLGIIGAGAGDPVFSGLLLLIGVAICLSNRSMNWGLRFGMLGTMLVSSFGMISTSTVVALIVLVAVYHISSRSLPKAASVLLVAVLLVVVAFQFYIGLPEASRIPALDALLNKTILKYEMLMSGNLSGATTFRSELSELYMNKFYSQSFIKKLIGGNSIPDPNIFVANYNLVSHNTYVDIVYRFGVVGALIFIPVMVVRYIRCFIDYKTNRQNGELFLIKTMLLLYSYSLSIYYGSFFSYWFVFLLLY